LEEGTRGKVPLREKKGEGGESERLRARINNGHALGKLMSQNLTVGVKVKKACNRPRGEAQENGAGKRKGGGLDRTPSFLWGAEGENLG